MLYITLGPTDNLQIRELDRHALNTAVNHFPEDIPAIAEKARIELKWFVHLLTNPHSQPTFSELLQIASAISAQVDHFIPEAVVSQSVIALVPRVTKSK